MSMPLMVLATTFDMRKVTAVGTTSIYSVNKEGRYCQRHIN